MNDELQDRLEMILAFRAAISAFSNLSHAQLEAFDDAMDESHDD